MSAENEQHVVAMRFRLIGSGNLKISLKDLSDIQVQTLVPIAMQVATRIEPTRLANFQSQRIRYRVETTEINEIFKISRVIMFAKPVAVEYPA